MKLILAIRHICASLRSHTERLNPQDFGQQVSGIGVRTFHHLQSAFYADHEEGMGEIKPQFPTFELVRNSNNVMGMNDNSEASATKTGRAVCVLVLRNGAHEHCSVGRRGAASLSIPEIRTQAIFSASNT